MVEKCSKNSFSVLSATSINTPVMGKIIRAAKSTIDMTLRDLKDLFSDDFMALIYFTDCPKRTNLNALQTSDTFVFILISDYRMFMNNDIYFSYHLPGTSADTFPTCLAFCCVQTNRLLVIHIKSSLV